MRACRHFPPSISIQYVNIMLSLVLRSKDWLDGLHLVNLWPGYDLLNFVDTLNCSIIKIVSHPHNNTNTLQECLLRSKTSRPSWWLLDVKMQRVWRLCVRRRTMRPSSRFGVVDTCTLWWWMRRRRRRSWGRLFHLVLSLRSSVPEASERHKQHGNKWRSKVFL